MSYHYFSVSNKTDFGKLKWPKAPFSALIADPFIQEPQIQMLLCFQLIESGCVALGAWGERKYSMG